MLTKHKDLRTGETVWAAYAAPHIKHSKLESDIQTDAVIIGTGISGAMIAQEISANGLKVAMLDSRLPLQGSTRASTALLQYEIDEPLSKLQKKIGYDKAMRSWRRARLAIDSLSAIASSICPDCHYGRRDTLYLAGNVLDADGLKKECEERNRIGLYNEYLTRKQLKDDYGIGRIAALKSFGNITVNPYLLAARLLKQTLENKGHIYSHTEAVEVESSNSGVRVVTKDGPVVKAKFAVFATGYEVPKYIKASGHKITSTWAIATRPQKSKLWKDECFIWEAASPYLYIRTTIDGRVICGGADEKFSASDKRDSLIKAKTKFLENQLGKLLPYIDNKADYSWAGTFGESSTGLPTIGPVPGHKNCYIMMGFGGNGITFSRIGAEVISAFIAGKVDPDADLFEF